MSAITPLPRTRTRPAPPPRRPDLRVVPTPRPRHTAIFALLIAAVFAASVFGTVSLNALAAADAMAAHELDAQVTEGERQYAQLVADVAGLTDPARIRRTARQAGMVKARSPRYLLVSRALPAHGAVVETVDGGESTDPMKPVLSAQR